MLTNNSSQLLQGFVGQRRLCAGETSRKDVSYIDVVIGKKKEVGEVVWIQCG